MTDRQRTVVQLLVYGLAVLGLVVGLGAMKPARLIGALRDQSRQNSKEVHMSLTKTATTDSEGAVSGTFLLNAAEESYSGRAPVYTLGVTAGSQSCGLSAAYWDMDANEYKYDLSSVGVGGTGELIGEDYEEGKRIFVVWIGQAVWAGEDPETAYQNAGVVQTSLIRRYAGVDPAPWTVSVNWKITVGSSHLWRDRTVSSGVGRDAAPVYAQETNAADQWIIDRPASVKVECGTLTLTAAQSWNATIEKWNPIIEHMTEAVLGYYCRGGTKGTEYAEITLKWAGEDAVFTNGYKQEAAWRLEGDGPKVTLENTTSTDADAGPYVVAYAAPYIIDWSGLSCKKLGSGDSLDVQVAGGFVADPRYPATLGWSTTPGPT
jgi:hypothetical protein